MGNCEVITKLNIGRDHRTFRAKSTRLKKIQKQKPFKLDPSVEKKPNYKEIPKFT